jgi:hypothetical protein
MKNMESLSEKEIQKICDLYKTYGNVKQVSKHSFRSVGAIHKYLTLHSLIKKQNIVKKINNNDEGLIGVYVGLWLGDGTQYIDRHQYTVKICSNKEDINLNQFIQNIILKIFNKTTNLLNESKTKRAYIKFNSRFIYNFIQNYAAYDVGKKTHTVKLRKRVCSYNASFLEGCLLGLVLSDGYLKDNFVFGVTSSRLAKNTYDILNKFGFNLRHSIQQREKYKWKNLHIISLNRKQSDRLRIFLDKIIYKLGFQCSFQELKYGPGRIS